MTVLKRALYLIRHGETDYNAEGRLQGQLDIPLNSRGRRQAARNGASLARLFADKGVGEADFDWVASPLTRARHTMEILRGEMGLVPTGYRSDPILKEISFGDWQGETLAEVKARDLSGHAARKADKWGFVPPGGESYEMLSQRIRPWLTSIEKDTVCVAHGGITRVVRGMLEGVSSLEIPVLDIPQDRIYVWNGTEARWV